MKRAHAGEIRRGEQRGRNRLRANGKETCSLAENAYFKRTYMQIMLTCRERGVKTPFSFDGLHGADFCNGFGDNGFEQADKEFFDCFSV